jgi:Putative Flp pilus-assembly TadE/G-like
VKLIIRSRRRRGFTLVTGGVLAVGLISMLGFAVDIGRMYINKNESQTYVDSTAIQAALELDGTLEGITRAQGALATNPNRWNFGTAAFVNPTIQFATSVNGPFVSNPATGTDYKFVTVLAGVNVPIYFLRIVSAIGNSTVITARGTAGQGAVNTFREGTFPFSPLAHNNGDAANFGLVRGGIYTMRWSANPQLPNGNGAKKNNAASGAIDGKPVFANNACYGDAVDTYLAPSQTDQYTNTFFVQAQAGGGSERGYISDTSAAIIRKAIVEDYQTAPLSVGDTVNMTGGAKNTEADALDERVAQDTDHTSQRFSQYVANGTGNGRRIVLLPINTYNPNYTLLGFRAFFLLTDGFYDGGGNDPFCAEYIGPYTRGGSHAGAGNPGAYVVRLAN